MDGDKSRQDAKDLFILRTLLETSVLMMNNKRDGLQTGLKFILQTNYEKLSLSELSKLATGFSIQVDAAALDVSATGLSVSISHSTNPSTLEITQNVHTDDESCSWTRLGFREGDIVEIQTSLE